jgi:hypothetical protein
MRFEQWLGTLLDQPEAEVRRIVRSKTALRFLIAWSMFESKCFGGVVTQKGLEPFAKHLNDERFDSSLIAKHTAHCHGRYQDPDRYRNLMHRQASKKLHALVRLPLNAIAPEDSIFLVTFVIYRFRNNMFHGNKKVQSWLAYREQIGLCVDAMQIFISHAESQKPSLTTQALAKL